MIGGDGISTEDIVKIAKSMKENECVITKDPVNRYQADFEKTETPAGWAGRCFPAALPGDLALDESNTGQECVVLQGKDGRRMTHVLVYLVIWQLCFLTSTLIHAEKRKK